MGWIDAEKDKQAAIAATEAGMRRDQFMRYAVEAPGSPVARRRDQKPRTGLRQRIASILLKLARKIDPCVDHLQIVPLPGSVYGQEFGGGWVGYILSSRAESPADTPER